MENETVMNLNEEIPAEEVAEGTVDFAEETESASKGGTSFQQLREDFMTKYREAQETCRKTVERLANDLKETGGNPYIRATSTFRYDLYRSADDTEPVDTFVFERTNGCSLRALALATGLITAAQIAVNTYLGKKF